MGIRIKRNLGYAIGGLRYSKKKWCLTDKRINPLGWLHTDYEDRKNIWTNDGFFNFCKHRMDKFDYHMLKWSFDKKINDKAQFFDIENYIIQDIEFGIPGVLMLQCPEWSDWSRNDNIIDYCEHSQLHRGIKNDILWLDAPIYPYAGYIDTETGERVNSSLVRHMWYNWRSAQYKDQSAKSKKLHMKLARVSSERLGLTLSQAKKRYAPHIPESIEMLAKYLCLFEDESTIWQLRPAIYTFWS